MPTNIVRIGVAPFSYTYETMPAMELSDPEGATLALFSKRRDRRANAPKGRDPAQRGRERECEC